MATREEAIRELARRELERRQPEPNRAAEVALSGVKGANSLVPGLLGLPVDTMTALRNLGRAGVGRMIDLVPQVTPFGEVPRNSAGVDIRPNPPGLIDPASQIGGSQFFKEQISKLTGDVFNPVNPEDPLQRAANIGGLVASSALVSPGLSAKQAATRTLPAAVGAAGANLAFPDQPLAPALGSLAGSSLASVKLPKTAPKAAAVKANQLGFKLLPKSAKETKTQDLAQGAAGPVPLKQLMSVENQKLTNSLVKRDLGIPDEVPISPDSLAAVRAEAGNVYQRVANQGRLKLDATYLNSLRRLKRPTAITKSFPGAIKKDHIAEVSRFESKNITSEGALEAIKQLRRDADAGFSSLDPAAKDLARLQGKIANNLEGLLARNVQKTNPALYPEFVNARKTIAKTYQVQKALVEGDNVSAIALGKALTKGKPMTGGVRDVAEFGKNFKEVAQPNPPQATNFRPLDLVAGIVGGSVRPELVGALFARPALRKILMSDFYQGRITKPLTGAQLKSVLSKPEGAQATALVILLNNATQTQPNSQSE